VHDFVRAQTRPYPGAFSPLGDGRVVRIWRSAVDARRMFGPPGAVMAVEGDTAVVACGDASALRVLACSIDDEVDVAPARALGSLRLRLGRRAPACRS
jgi:methionyl-tRNA formyltransferase